jgi:hypothetical protein
MSEVRGQIGGFQSCNGSRVGCKCKFSAISVCDCNTEQGSKYGNVDRVDGRLSRAGMALANLLLRANAGEAKELNIQPVKIC